MEIEVEGTQLPVEKTNAVVTHVDETGRQIVINISGEDLVEKPAPKTITVEKEYDLTEEEKKKMAIEIVEIDMRVKEESQSLTNLKAKVSSLNKILDGMNENRIRISELYNLGVKTIQHKCIISPNYEAGLYEYCDIETGEIIKTEPFRPGDMFNPVNV